MGAGKFDNIVDCHGDRWILAANLGQSQTSRKASPWLPDSKGSANDSPRSSDSVRGRSQNREPKESTLYASESLFALTMPHRTLLPTLALAIRVDCVVTRLLLPPVKSVPTSLPKGARSECKGCIHQPWQHTSEWQLPYHPGGQLQANRLPYDSLLPVSLQHLYTNMISLLPVSLQHLYTHSKVRDITRHALAIAHSKR